MARGPAVPRETRGTYIYQYQLLDREGEVIYEDEELDGVMLNLGRAAGYDGR